MVDVGKGATFSGDMAQVDLLGLDLDLRAVAHCTNSPLIALNVNKPQITGMKCNEMKATGFKKRENECDEMT